MTEVLASSLASTVTGQIGQLALAAAVLLVLAVVMLLAQRRLGRARPPANDGDGERPAAAPARTVLVVGVLVLALLALILAAGLRQVWGHPVLGTRALWSLVAVVLAAALVWWRTGDPEAPS